MGIGSAVALGGLGEGLIGAAGAYARATKEDELERHRLAQEKLAGQRANMSLMFDTQRAGGHVGHLDSRFWNADGSVKSANGNGSTSVGQVVGQSSATLDPTPFGTESHNSRAMKLAGNIDGQEIWLPDDGLTDNQFERERDRREKIAAFNASRIKRRALASNFKFTHPEESLLGGLDDMETGDNTWNSLVKNEEEADPAWVARQAKLAGSKAVQIAIGTEPIKKEIKAAPGPNQPAKDANSRRIQLEHQATGVNQQLTETDRQISQMRSQYNNLQRNPPPRRDTTAYNQYQQELSSLAAGLQPGSPWVARGDSLRGVTDSLRREQQNLPPIGSTTPPGASPIPGLLTPQSPAAAVARQGGGSVLRGGGAAQQQAAPANESTGPDAAEKELEEAHILYHRHQNVPGAKEAYDQAVKEIRQKYSLPQR